MHRNIRSYFSAGSTRLSKGWPVLLIALLQFVLHMWVGTHDNFFRDELYYIAASRHLDFGYVDFPPLVALATAGVRLLLGGSVFALRLLPAVSGVLVILLTADMVARLGGGRLPQLLAAVAVGLGPVFIGSSGLMGIDPFDQFWWTVCAWTLLRIIKEQRPRLWLLFGLFAGLGLLNKLTIGFYVTALVLGVLLSNQRKLLFNRWFIFGGLLAFLLISPYILWNAAHGFPTLEFTRNYSKGGTYQQPTPIEFLLQQIVTVNPLASFLWLGGLYLLFFTAAGKPYRAFGWAYLFLHIFFTLQKTKYYWLSPAFPALFAAGAYALGLLVQKRSRLAWLQPTYIWVLAISGLLLVPFAIPILPPQTYLRLSGGASAGSSALPQVFADRYGWRELAASVKQAYSTLTPQEQAEACVFTSNYGEAGAINLYGPALGLPKAISGHNSYFIWGPQGCTGNVLITVNIPLSDLVSIFDSVEPAGITSCTYCVAYENNVPIFIARGLHVNIQEAWPGVKDYQ
jgi:4-amino-4-deoxy-L-arabinose transferase-like glycosyltransferase